MTSPFMDAYVQLLIKTCHKRGVHAMGGMAAQIPIKNDPAANEAALNKVGEQSACCWHHLCFGILDNISSKCSRTWLCS